MLGGGDGGGDYTVGYSGNVGNVVVVEVVIAVDHCVSDSCCLLLFLL